MIDLLQGRNNLGSIYVFSSGNGGIYEDSCAFDGYVNSIYTIAVASVGAKGDIPVHSEPCGAIITSVYSKNLVRFLSLYFFFFLYLKVYLEASVAQSSKRRPPNTKVVGSSPVSNIWSHVRRFRQHSAESCGFPPRPSCSSHRESCSTGLFMINCLENRPLKSP